FEVRLNQDPGGPASVLGEVVEMYTDNRAATHLHGGVTPWISDGTPAGTRPLEQQIASKKTDPARQTEDKRVSQLPAGEDHAHRI
ncbi:MAG: hypothetical protein ACE5ET_02410, partial [Gammaproteobacteria bacterium]